MDRKCFIAEYIWTREDNAGWNITTERWLELFAETGYDATGQQHVVLRYPLTLYRGTTERGRHGMTWTWDLAIARRFRDRYRRRVRTRTSTGRRSSAPPCSPCSSHGRNVR